MTQDYISYIRSKVGHDKIMLTFAGGILTDDAGRILLQKRGDFGKWGLPGGAMELGESSLETAIREFAEETGIKVTAKRLLNVYTNSEHHYLNGDICQSITFIYEMVAEESYDISAHRDDESLELRFFTKEEIDQLALAFDSHRLMIEEYVSGSFAMGH
ncbi:NUDIX hydrolase [Streptococcus entericus]|uniref:NUDIX hydrolase n=1 Tax=Streptococcus entericus TaxID=155680 RepID=UPI0003698B80|nr:NUDIX domain-containing protein [Streptococcus entericus]